MMAKKNEDIFHLLAVFRQQQQQRALSIEHRVQRKTFHGNNNSLNGELRIAPPYQAFYYTTLSHTAMITIDGNLGNYLFCCCFASHIVRGRQASEKILSQATRRREREKLKIIRRTTFYMQIKGGQKERSPSRRRNEVEWNICCRNKLWIAR